MQQPVVDDGLRSVKESHGSIWTILVENCMDDTTATSTNSLLGEQPIHQLTAVDKETAVA